MAARMLSLLLLLLSFTALMTLAEAETEAETGDCKAVERFVLVFAVMLETREDGSPIAEIARQSSRESCT